MNSEGSNGFLKEACKTPVLVAVLPTCWSISHQARQIISQSGTNGKGKPSLAQAAVTLKAYWHSLCDFFDTHPTERAVA